MLTERLQFTKKLNELYVPSFFRLADSTDLQAFNELVANDCVMVFDEIYDQLRELIKSRNPKIKLTAADYEQRITQHIGATPITEYGVWVYYPWSQRLVHILDKEEFIELRTSANKNKITIAERERLATKKVGVIGLSVGQSVSMTLALERGCGELRIADFDRLELNNMNRIRTGVHNLGLLKTYAVAREIAELDPYFKVVCFSEGITEANIHQFFTENGKLDLVIDECDGVNIKILCRIKARELNVPVLMEASDRGTLDVERFDLEPDRPIIHGWLEGLTLDFEIINKLKTAEEKLPYMLPISGLDTLSPRMKASMVEIEQTITTWPQLATAVTLGGALTADTCRRIFLDQFTNSGRYFIDLEELIPDTREKPVINYHIEEQPLTVDYMNELAAKATSGMQLHSELPERAVLMELLEAARQAPSAGNNQPWKWHLTNSCLFLFHDRIRSVTFGDFEDIASYVAFGAAIENLELQAHKHHVGLDITTFPIESKKLIAVIQFRQEEKPTGLYMPDVLVEEIGNRLTNRNLGDRVPLGADLKAQLEAAVSSIAGAELLIRESTADMIELANIMSSSERLRMLHAEGHYEFYNKEVRWDDEHSRTTADGIDIGTLDVKPSEVVGLKLVKDPRVVALLAEWRAGTGLESIARKAIASASAIGLIVMPEYTPLDYVLGGRAVERMWLMASKLNVAMQPMLAAPLHFARLNYGNGEGLPDFMKEEFTELYKRFEKVFPGLGGKGQIFLFRLCIAETPRVKSYRLPLGNILTES